MNFAEFIHKKRIEKNFTLRELAIKLEISFSYLSDVEKGRAKAFKLELLKKLVDIFELDQDESDLMYNLAAKSQDEVPADIAEYMKKNPDAVVAFRKEMRKNSYGQN